MLVNLLIVKGYNFLKDKEKNGCIQY